ncbi:hypothetical protein J6590_010591 [Homalodisca vitripennis]|nr:hypothetical protein J6590_010591 [Homalodisca vitripennis]
MAKECCVSLGALIETKKETGFIELQWKEKWGQTSSQKNSYDPARFRKGWRKHSQRMQMTLRRREKSRETAEETTSDSTCDENDLIGQNKVLQ